MRLFAGLPITDPAMMSTLARAVSRLQAAGADLRWVPPENWHVTVEFLGDASVPQFECVVQALRAVRSVPVQIELGGLEVLGRDGALVVSVLPNEALASLQKKVVAATAGCGFTADDRPYHPHITLARSRRGAKRKLSLRSGAVAEGQPAAALVREFVLYESQLGPGGARYAARERISLS